MWRLPWGLLGGISGRKDLCMVPCHSCHIYGIWKSRSKKVWGCLKVTNCGWWCKSQKGGGGALHREGRFSLCNMLYCETSLEVLLGIYCKRFYWIPRFTILLLFYVFEVGKAKTAAQIVLMILKLNGLFQKNFQVFYFIPENSISLTLPPPFPPLFVSIIMFVL